MVHDPVTFKAEARAAWDASAQGWNEHAPQLRAWLHEATEAMLDMAGIGAGARVLDVAAGAGDQTLDIARRVGPQGHVLATDLSPGILALARANALQAGFQQIATRVADGEELGVAPQSFDAVVCRLGLMLFPDPARALHEMHAALRPAGGVCVMVFGRPERNPCLSILMRTALEHAGLPPRDPFQAGGLLSLSRPGLLETLFRQAGLRDVATTELDAPFRLPSARHYVAFVQRSASPIQAILARLSPAAAQRAWEQMQQRLEQFETPSGWVGPNALALTAARRPVDPLSNSGA